MWHRHVPAAANLVRLHREGGRRRDPSAQRSAHARLVHPPEAARLDRAVLSSCILASGGSTTAGRGADVGGGDLGLHGSWVLLVCVLWLVIRARAIALRLSRRRHAITTKRTDLRFIERST